MYKIQVHHKHTIKTQWRGTTKVLNLFMIEKVLLTEKYKPLIWSVLNANSITNKYKMHVHKSFSFTLEQEQLQKNND